MKAKYYVSEILVRRKNGTAIPEIIDWLLKSFVEETNRLIASRKPHVDSAFFGIFNELDDKWRAVSDGTHGALTVDGYRRLLNEIHPLGYYKWMKSKDNNRFAADVKARR